ncbi:Os05g0421450 [Oryza sativa Japonica Group]|uniref:Os05g0421450 protein n=1 Tax=Oryza sativa subsp. japonica TaxID=39947 RepID=A0A0N7KKT1_ORYSJ|nr:hypothetical protein EE612_029580 [Oryza sativa]BAS94081.1 Os05g0421450 [Oryza sativa Japonica Group]
MATGLGVPTGLSAPVAFQYPDPAARFGRDPFGYLRSRGEKKYHSFSPYSAIPAWSHGRSMNSSYKFAWMEEGDGRDVLGRCHGSNL